MGQIVEDIAGLWDREHKIRRKHKKRCQRRRKSIKQRTKATEEKERQLADRLCGWREREDLSTNCILRSSYDISRRFHLLSSFTASEGDSGSSFR